MLWDFHQALGVLLLHVIALDLLGMRAVARTFSLGRRPAINQKFSLKLKYSPPTPSFFSCVITYTISPNYRPYLPDFSYSQPFEHFASQDVLMKFLPNSSKQWVLQVTASSVRIKYVWKYSSGGRAICYAASSLCLYLANTHLCSPGVVAWKETPR